MTILVTGGAGFIGRHLVERLLMENHKVIVADFPEKHFKDVTYYGLDLSKEDWSQISEEIDIIYHLAAQPYGRGSEELPFQDLSYNTEAFLKMCYFAKAKKVKKVIYTSTMAVYGNNELARESDQLQPLSNYAVSKLYGEFCLKKFAAQGYFEYSILRLWNTYGPGQDLQNKSKGIVSSLGQQVVNSNEVYVTGSLNRFRDIVYVVDVVNALLLCLQPQTNGEVYNISSGIRTTIKELIHTLITSSGKALDEVSIIEGPSHEGDQHGCVGDSSKIQKIGWLPTTSLEKGLITFLKYLKEYEK
jgi:UDP-glucose 4-epimerase